MSQDFSAKQTKRIEFAELGSSDRFVVFEGHENHPFWNRKGEIAHVFTDLTFDRAKLAAERGIVKQTNVEGPEAYEDYLRLANTTHDQYAGKKEGA